VASNSRHTRSHPQLPLAVPEENPEVIRRKEKSSLRESFASQTSISAPPAVKTPLSCSQLSSYPFSEVSRSLNFGSVPTEFSPPGEILVTPPSLEVVPQYRPQASEGFTTPLVATITTQKEASAHSSPLALSLFSPLSPSPSRSSLLISPLHTSSPPGSPLPNIPMAGANPPLNRMDAIVVARYAPLILPQPMHPLPVGDYLKYMPKFTGEEDVTGEEHLAAFYSYADNINIEHEYVWMRVFIQSLDGDVRKWFRGLALGSIAGIEALDSVFLRQWGDRKDFMYYMTEFGSLNKVEGESVSDFSKRFNKMYNKIPAEVKPSEASAQISYAGAFDPDFCLLLRERRATSLAQMQDESIEVESNILAADRLRSKTDVDRRMGKSEASTSGPSLPHTQVNEVTQVMKFLSEKWKELRWKGSK